VCVCVCVCVRARVSGTWRSHRDLEKKLFQGGTNRARGGWECNVKKMNVGQMKFFLIVRRK
jgi:hypothetical protein